MPYQASKSSAQNKQATESSKAPHILVFDSGAGAFSVFQEIQQLGPDYQCSLVLDNAHFPYGTLPESDLHHRVVNVVGNFIQRLSPDLAIIACNTASTLVLDALRQTFDIPFVGVVPAIKPAANQSSSQIIGLLATPATIERSYTDNLIEDFAPNCEILKVGSTELVYMAEQKLRGSEVDLSSLEKIVEPFVTHSELDTLVLACTHFPLLKEELSQVLPGRIKLLDSGAAIAQRVNSLLAQPAESDARLSVRDTNNVGNHHIYLTSMDAEISAITQYANRLGVDSLEVVRL